MLLVSLTVESFADARNVVQVADLGDDQLAQREHVALGRHAGVDDDLAAIAIVERHAERARVDLDRGAAKVIEGHQTAERASHAATSRRSRCRGGQRDSVALDWLRGDVTNVDKQRSHQSTTSTSMFRLRPPMTRHAAVHICRTISSESSTPWRYAIDCELPVLHAGSTCSTIPSNWSTIC